MQLTAGPGSENQLFGKLIEGISWVFPNLSVFDLKTTAAYGLPVEVLQTLWSGLYGISYIGLILIITIFVFQRRELT
jgi:hypothetical protein